MATLRELKGRIGSVASSEKITGAMKMISSAKMHKAEQALKRLQPFRRQLTYILGNLLSSDSTFSSPLMEVRPVSNVTIVAFGSDDGLCGAYNANLYKVLVRHIAELRSQYGDKTTFSIYPVGKKIAKLVSKLEDASLRVVIPDNINSKSEGETVNAFTAQLRESFLNKDTDRVELLYMGFQSLSRQRSTIDCLLPMTPPEADGKTASRPYIFEPDAATIFRAIIPMFVMSVMQDVFIENRASEQAARVMAMQSANDNARKLLEELQLEYNKLRQQSITTELLDILGGQIR